MKELSITFIVGARPNFIKIAPLLYEARRRRLRVRLIHTGQHFSPEMSRSFFEDLEIPEPDCNLGVSSGTQVEQMAAIMTGLEPVLRERPEDMLVVVGDVTSTVAAALVGAKTGLRVAHVEAGLRSYDRTMPEEINRIVTDAVSDYLFTTEPSGEENLLREGVPPHKIFFVGNVMIDTLLRHRNKATRSNALTELRLEPRGYVIVTLHRPSNVDDPARLSELVNVLDTIGEGIRVIFPVHPRTRERLLASDLRPSNITLIPPQSYLDFVHLMANARAVLTDSGGIQEETTILQVPCLTMRDNTERPVTITRGTNRLVGVNPGKIAAAALETLKSPPTETKMPELWDGAAAGRIIDALQA
jgi:UDP-N-acetylglucosamine 2-epimerase (non-hydrolysing)